MNRHRFYKNYGKITLIFALIIFIIGIIQKYEYSPDDTFIYLKYSQNIASGNNFSFNKGEPSFGVTSPVWVLLNVIPFLIGVNAFWFAKSLDLFFILCSFMIFYMLAKSFWSNDDYEFRILAVSLFMVNPWVIRSSFTGMETSLAIMLVVSVFYLYFTGKFYLLFLLTGLSALVRPETFLLSFIFLGLVIYNFSKEHNFNLFLIIKFVCSALIITVPFWIFAYFNFGTVVSNTSLGKAVLTNEPGLILLNAKEIVRIFVLTSPLEIVIASGAVIMLVYKKKFNKFLPAGFWICSLLFLYIFSAAAVMARYFLILYPFIVLLCVKLIENVKIKHKYVIPAVMIFFIAYSGIIFYKYVKPYCDGYTSGVNNCLIPLGTWLNNNTPEGSKILVNDVGVIGFYADRYIIDAAALINRDLNLNKKILSVPLSEKEFPHLMLNFIETDYLVEKDSTKMETLNKAYNYKLEHLKTFVFPQIWVLDPNPKYYNIYRVQK